MHFLIGFKEGFREFGKLIVSLVNFLLLSIIYILGIGLTSIVAKIFRKRFLHLELDSKSKSYWVNLNIGERPTEKYYDQF
jgi:hypothetical protein